MKHEKQKELLEAIWNYQLKSPLYFHTDCNDTNFKGDKLVTDVLPPKMRGLYWLWTDYGFDELEQLTRGSSKNKSEVNIDQLVKQRRNLNNICSLTHEDNDKFRLVYNGKGGYNGKSKGFGLRERILQEFFANAKGTGTLNLLNKNRIGKPVNEDEKKEEHAKHWAVTFFNFDGVDEQKLIQKVLGEENYDADKFYNNYSSSLEINWRIQYGVPILSRL